jgi:mono/diheme cytochrome c family protein
MLLLKPIRSLPLSMLILFLSVMLLNACSPDRKGKQPANDSGQNAAEAPPVFYPEIASLLFENCTPCHRKGGSGPFALTEYEDIRKRTKMIKLVTSRRIMPPWPADPEYRHFLGEKTLTQNQIDRIAQWVDNGAPLGSKEHQVFPGYFPETSNLGEPDLVLRFPPFSVPGDGRDHFLLMKIPYTLPNDTFVRAIEFVPGQRSLVHHMNANLIGYRPGAKKNVFEGQRIIPTDLHAAAVDVHQQMDNLNDDGTWPDLTRMVCNYLPGVQHTAYPEGIGGFRLPKSGAFFINDMHYGPSSVPLGDESRFNIFYAAKAPERPTYEFMMGTFGESGTPIEPPLIVPPDTVMTFRTEFTLPQDISLLTINPHMHLLGKSFLAYAVTPALDTIPLVRIPKWNFRWQYFYTFDHMLPLKAGTTIYVEGVMDNTLNNKDNPFAPPQWVREPADGSMRTVDEMLQFIVTYVPYRPGDEQISLDVPLLSKGTHQHAGVSSEK